MKRIQEFNRYITELLMNGYEVIIGVSNEDNNLSVIFYGKCSIWAFIKRSLEKNNKFEYGVLEKDEGRYELKVLSTGDNFIDDSIDFINEVGKDFSQSNIKPKQIYFDDILLLEIMFSENSEYGKKSNWKYIKNDCFYKQGGRFIDSRLEKNIKGYYCIDGLQSHDIRTSTELARVIITEGDEVFVVYINDLAKYDEYAQQKIQECVSWIKEKKYEGYGI